MASCISQDSFEPFDPDDDTKLETTIEQLLGDKSVNAVISQPDMSTPLSLEKLEIDAGTVGEKSVAAQSPPIRMDSCVNCVEVKTTKLDEGTDFLRTEATVAAAGAAVAGVLLLAVSG